MKHATPHAFSFDSRSVMLFAALAMGSAASLQAQTPAPKTQASRFSSGAAAPAPSPASVAFDRTDANRDGLLSREEFDAVAQS